MDALLYLDGESLSAWTWRWRKLSPGPRFSDAGPDFLAWLGSQRGAVFTLIADVVDEAFQAEALPPASGSDRSAMIARKLSQLFFGSPYCAALSLGKQSGPHPEERILCAALTRPAQIEPWIAALASLDAPLAGLKLCAQFAAALLPRALRAEPRLLQVCLTPAGIRQNLLEAGQLRFSRLAMLSEGEDWIARLPHEVHKTRQYLLAQHVLARGEVLPVAVLASDAERPGLAQLGSDSEALRYIAVDPAPLARAAALPEGSGALALLLREAARRARGPQFAPPRDRQAFRWRQLGQALLLAGGAMLAASLALAAKREADVESLNASRAALQRESLSQKNRLARLPRPGHSAAALQAALDERQRAGLDTTRFAADLKGASRVLDRHRDVELDALVWSQQPGVRSLKLDIRAPDGGLAAAESLGESLRLAGASEVLVQRREAGAHDGQGFSLSLRYPESRR